MPGLAAVTVLGAGGKRGRPSRAHASLSPAFRLAGAAEGDAEGAHAAGRGAALCHLLPGHAAADADPAGPHPAQPADGLLQVAHPDGPAGKGPGQVRPTGTVSLGADGPVCGDGEMLCAGTGVPAARFPLWPQHSADRRRHAGVLGSVPCCLSPRSDLLCPVPVHALGSALARALSSGWACSTLQCPSSVLRLSVWCALSSYSSHNKGQASARQKKRHREDIEVRPAWSGVWLEAPCAQERAVSAGGDGGRRSG